MTETVAEQAPDETEQPAEPVEAPESPGEPETYPAPPEEPEGPEEPEQAPPAGMSEKQLDQAMQKLEREAKRHRDRISEIMGEEATILVPCALCDPNFAGFRFPLVPPDDVREAVRVAIGDADGQDYLKAPDARICEGCNGLGQVLTGSLVPSHRTKLCTRCRGAGYVDVGGPPPVSLAAQNGGESPPVLEAVPEASPDVDPWGRPRGDHDYGRLPNYVT